MTTFDTETINQYLLEIRTLGSLALDKENDYFFYALQQAIEAKKLYDGTGLITIPKSCLTKEGLREIIQNAEDWGRAENKESIKYYAERLNKLI